MRFVLIMHALTEADQPDSLSLVQRVSTEDARRIIVTVLQPLQIRLHNTLKPTVDVHNAYSI